MKKKRKTTGRTFFALFFLITLIYFLNCQQFDHTNPVDPEYKGTKNKLPETTKIVPDQVWDENKISFSQDSSNLIIDKSIAENYEVGDVVISTKGEGILKKITEIKTDSAQTTATIVDASLNEAIEEGTASFDSAFAKMEIAKIENYGDGAYCKLAKPSDPNSPKTTFDIKIILYDKDGNNNTKGDQTRLHGQFHMDQTIRGELEIKAWGVKRIMFEYEINQSLDLNCEIALANLSGNWQYNKEKPLAKITYTPMTAMAGPVPIIIIPVLELNAGIELNVGATVKTGITQSFNYTMGIEYANKSWTPYNEINTDFSYKPAELEGNASVTAYIRPEFKFKIYGTVAPKVFAQLSGILEGSVTIPSFDLNCKLSAAFAAGAGVDMKIFDKSIFDFRADIIEAEWVIYEWTNHPDLPSAPTLYVPTNGQTITESKPLLDWGEVDLAETYEIVVDDQDNFSSPAFSQAGIEDSDYRTNNDLADGSYYWRVRGIDNKERSGGWSSSWQFTVDTDGPATLSLQTPPNGETITDNTPLFDWTETSDAQVYELMVDNSNGFGNPEIHKSSLAQSEYTPISALDDNTYFWKVRARDAAGNWGDWTTEYYFTLDTQGPSAPSLSSPTNGQVLTDGVVLFEWSDVSGVAVYEIMVDNNSQFNQPEIRDGTLTTSTFFTTTALTDATYHWRVRARDEAGNWGDWSESWDFTIDTTGPTSPTLINPSYGEQVTDFTPKLQWESADDAVKHELIVATDESFYSPIIQKNNISGDEFTPNADLAEGDYYWKVRSCDTHGNWGGWSVSGMFTIKASKPDTPVLINPEENATLTNNTPTFNWSDIAGASEYRILVDNNYDFSDPEIDTDDLTASEYTAESVLEDGYYSWKVRAKTGFISWSDWSTVWTFSINTVTLSFITILPLTETVDNSQTQQFICTATYSDQDTVDVTTEADWSVNPGTAGSIDATGLFTADATATGTESITATFQGHTSQATVTVQSGEVPIEIEFVYVDGGTFQMGSNDGRSDEQPVHTVTLTGFEISKYEITNAQYCKFLNDIGVNLLGSFGGTIYIYILRSSCQIEYSGGQFVVKSGKDNNPVIQVSWYGAKAFCEWAGGRLPTEAEWEYASRGGNQSQGYTYSGSNNVDDVAWYLSNSGGLTHPVGQKQSNELGIYDMSGNVWEWCKDWYGIDYYSSSPTNNPQGPTTGVFRVLRGGSWYSGAFSVRCADRGNYDPSNSYINFGFRCVR